MPSNAPAQPWHSFLNELDAAAQEEVHLHCIGGFVTTQMYGCPRYTEDIDALMIAPATEATRLLALGGKGSDLHRRFGVYLERVGVATYPEDYDQRLSEMYPAVFRNLRLLATDPHDVLLAKIERNGQRDREDLRHLASAGYLRSDILKQRYEQELRPYLVNTDRHDLTLRLWIEVIEELSGNA